MSEAYRRLRQIHEDVSVNIEIDIADTEPVGVTGKALSTIFVQRGTLTVLDPGPAGTTWTIGDDESVFISQDFPVGPTDPVSVPFDFTFAGRALTEGAALIISCSGPGASGFVTCEAYRKLTGVGGI